jgi:hypothetical protein
MRNTPNKELLTMEEKMKLNGNYYRHKKVAEKFSSNETL